MSGDARGDARVDIVMVPRERYSPTLSSLNDVVSSVPTDTRIVLVRGGTPRRIVRRLKASHPNRVQVVGPERHLAPNVARTIGLRYTTARHVVFIDNDIRPSPGWLEPLTAAAELQDAWVVRPVVLQEIGGRLTVHEAGGDCHLAREGPLTQLVESHRHSGRTPEEVGPLCAEQVELFEFHTVLFDRARLVGLGGPDERMLSQGDHLDLALRIKAAGGSIWLEPSSQVTYVIPHSIGLRDLPFFLGRWSHSWNQMSRTAFRGKHGVNEPSDTSGTWRYPDFHRSHAWMPLGRVVATLTRRPVARRVARRFDRYFGRVIAEAMLRVAPRWRGHGEEGQTS